MDLLFRIVVASLPLGISLAIFLLLRTSRANGYLPGKWGQNVYRVGQPKAFFWNSLVIGLMGIFFAALAVWAFVKP